MTQAEKVKIEEKLFNDPNPGSYWQKITCFCHLNAIDKHTLRTVLSGGIIQSAV